MKATAIVSSPIVQAAIDRDVKRRFRFRLRTAQDFLRKKDCDYRQGREVKPHTLRIRFSLLHELAEVVLPNSGGSVGTVAAGGI